MALPKYRSLDAVRAIAHLIRLARHKLVLAPLSALPLVELRKSGYAVDMLKKDKRTTSDLLLWVYTRRNSTATANGSVNQRQITASLSMNSNGSSRAVGGISAYMALEEKYFQWRYQFGVKR